MGGLIAFALGLGVILALAASVPAEQTVRQLFAGEALAVLGLGADPEHRREYLDLVGPDESEAMQRDMLKMNGCALTVRGIWRRVGIRHPRLDAPYKIGMAVADVFQIAKEVGAWRTHGVPQVGDVYLIDSPEHVGTVVEVDRDVLASVDGGQRDAQGNQAIRMRRRRVEGTELVPEDGIGGRRPLKGYVDCVALAKGYLGRGIA